MNTNTNKNNELTPLVSQPAATTRRGFIKRTACAALLTTFAFDAFAETSICGLENCSLPHYSIFLTSHDYPDRTPKPYVRPGGNPSLTAYFQDGGNKPVSTPAAPVEQYNFQFVSNFRWKQEPDTPKTYPAPGIDKGLNYQCWVQYLYMGILISERPARQSVTLTNGIFPPANFVDANFALLECGWALDDRHDSEATKTASPNSGNSKNIGIAITPIDLLIDIGGLLAQKYGTLSGTINWKIGYSIDKTTAELKYTVGASGTLKLTHYVVKPDGSGFVLKPNSLVDYVTQEHNVELAFEEGYPCVYNLEVKKLPQLPPSPMPTQSAMPEVEPPVGVTPPPPPPVTPPPVTPPPVTPPPVTPPPPPPEP